jgi:predicted GNAT superfamily acetyltransferase
VLGATARTYEVNLYGPRTDALNAGLDTDRLIVEWPTTDRPEGRATRWSDARELIETAPGPGERARPAAVCCPDGAPRLHLAIPASIRDLLVHEPELAREWQLAVRRAFESAFEAGYRAVGFARGEQSCYLLERAP